MHSTLNSYTKDSFTAAETIHQETKKRHGEKYQTVGYYLKIYRSRKSLTQKELAELTGLRQHHLSEMENNKRPIGKGMAKKIAVILDIDYRKLL